MPYTFRITQAVERRKAVAVTNAVQAAIHGKAPSGTSVRIICIADANAQFGWPNRPGDELCSVWLNTPRPASRKLMDAANEAAKAVLNEAVA